MTYAGEVRCAEIHKAQVYSDPAKADRFGSIKNKAEIWSIALSPDLARIITGSEDQSVAIVDAQTLQVLRVIEGHTLAVTSVAWQMVPGLGEVLVSCSDDKLARFYTPETLEPRLQLTSALITDWHTLTYLAIEQGGSRLAIGTQNGYLLVFDMLAEQFVFAEKLHLGGVEGLAFDHGRITTVSSDLVVNVVHL